MEKRKEEVNESLESILKNFYEEELIAWCFLWLAASINKDVVGMHKKQLRLSYHKVHWTFLLESST